MRDADSKAVKEFVRDLTAWLPIVWRLEAAGPYGGNVPRGVVLVHDATHPAHSALKESLRRLRERWPASELGSTAADAYFQPTAWQRSIERSDPKRAITLTILTAVLATDPPADICGRIELRLRRIFSQQDLDQGPEDASELSWGGYLDPHIGDCLELLVALPHSFAVLDLIEKIVRGDVDAGPFLDTRYGPDRAPLRMAYEIYGRVLCGHAPDLLSRLHQHGRLTYELFRVFGCRVPEILEAASAPVTEFGFPSREFYENANPEFRALILDYCQRVAWELAQGLSDDNSRAAKHLRNLHGSRFILEAARHHAARSLPGRLIYQNYRYRDGIDTAIVHLAQAPVEEMTAHQFGEFVDALRAYPPKTLKAILPVAPHVREAVCEALGWQSTIPLVQEIVKHAGLHKPRVPWEGPRRTSADPSEWVLDTARARDALNKPGHPVSREILKLFRGALVGAGPTVALMESVLGWNRKWVEGGIHKRNQLAVKAYGLLPLERGEQEVLERYLFLKVFAKESKQFGLNRQASERAAAEAGLTNLAQVAGFGDAIRLEWAMESLLGHQVGIEAHRTWQVGEFTLVLDPETSRLIVSKEDKQLKSVPAAVRKGKEYADAKAAVDQLRTHLKRLRGTLETLLSSEDPVNPRDLGYLRHLPGREILNRLVFLAPESVIGLLDIEANVLVAPEGATVEISGPLVVAHPYHLLKAGQLSLWQKEIVRRCIVQPFKQVFREVYVLTPAEQETGTHSNRFAGHVLESKVASRLFQARGWQFMQGDVAIPFKVLPKWGLRALFDFTDAGHFLAETETITSDQIFFGRTGETAESDFAESRRVSLVDVPVIAFSEIMRDADLVVSVAQRGEEGLMSQESYQSRANLIRSLLDEWGLPGVTIEGHFAFVKGRLATYRVHLGSATIHIVPGNYVCIVPDRPIRRDSLFLPFVDEGDRKVTEVLSKILLLVNDHQIKDEGILRQIRVAQPRA